MARELNRILAAGEDFVRRNIGSQSAREAQKRRVQRTIGEVLRRLRRSVFVLVGLLAGLVAYSILVDPITFLTWLAALPTAFLIAFASLFWPRSRPKPLEQAAAAPKARLDQLAVRAEDALVDRYRELPPQALAAADATILRLHELQPHLAELDAQGMLAGDAKRLICEHLPRLIDTYLALPAAARAPASEESRRFAESLGLVAEELDHLFEQCCRDRHLRFETQHRFIESRYKQDRWLKGGLEHGR